MDVLVHLYSIYYSVILIYYCCTFCVAKQKNITDIVLEATVLNYV